jgi:NitT/TauT family transport system permease protein
MTRARRPAPIGAARPRLLGLLRPVLLGILALVLAVAAWELFKAIGGGRSLLGVSTDDRSMPHVWDMVTRLGDPENRGTDRPVGLAVLAGAWYTLRLSLAGLVLGVAVGLGLAVVMQRWALAERALLPYVVVSQTIPLIALAPLIVAWGGELSIGPFEWKAWMSVAVVGGYLAFCPIAVGALRGLQSPEPAAEELFRSYGASRGATLGKLRFPSAVPYLVPALRLAAALSVVGAIVAEISTGLKGGIGRLILEYSREATGDPAKVYTAMFGAAGLGIGVAGLVLALDAWLMRNRPKEGVR